MWCLHFTLAEISEWPQSGEPLLPTILLSLKEVAKIDAKLKDSVIKEYAVKKVLRRDEIVSDPIYDTFNESFVHYGQYSTYADPIVDELTTAVAIVTRKQAESKFQHDIRRCGATLVHWE